MKCEIIKDLLPSYIDGLTSPESNITIQEHLDNCSQCSAYFEEMQNSIDLKSTTPEINPFVKIKRDNLRKLILAIFITAAIVGVSIEGYHNYWSYGKSTRSTEMTLSCQKHGDVTQLVFEPTDERTRFIVAHGGENTEVNGIMPYDTLSIIKYNEKRSEDERIRNGFYDMIFLDENTFIELQDFPEISEITEEDVIAVKYDDKTILINIRDLYYGKVTIK